MNVGLRLMPLRSQRLRFAKWVLTTLHALCVVMSGLFLVAMGMSLWGYATLGPVRPKWCDPIGLLIAHLLMLAMIALTWRLVRQDLPPLLAKFVNQDGDED